MYYSGKFVRVFIKLCGILQKGLKISPFVIYARSFKSSLATASDEPGF